MVLAESLPQQPVLSEGPQLGTHLAQAHQVPAIRQTLHDVQLQTGRQVSQSHAYRCGPVDLDVVQLLLPLHDVLHTAHPGVYVPHQDRLAHVLNKTAQRDVERLQQLLDGTNVLLVIKNFLYHSLQNIHVVFLRHSAERGELGFGNKLKELEQRQKETNTT